MLFYFCLFSSEQDKADWLKVHTVPILDCVSEAGKVGCVKHLLILFPGFPGDHRDLPTEKRVIQECAERRG